MKNNCNEVMESNTSAKASGKNKTKKIKDEKADNRHKWLKMIFNEFEPNNFQVCMVAENDYCAIVADIKTNEIYLFEFLGKESRCLSGSGKFEFTKGGDVPPREFIREAIKRIRQLK